MSTGNRPVDVCALCDRPIEGVDQGPHGFDAPGADHHHYLGPGWVHGGGREGIDVHLSCATFGIGSTGRIPGWVPDDERPVWLAEWESRTGRFDREFVHDEWHQQYDGTGVACHRSGCEVAA